MGSSQYAKIKVYAAVFEKNSNNDFVYDSNNEKILVKPYTTVLNSDDYTVVVEITEQYTD